MASTSKNNVLSVIFDITRSAVGRATYDRKVPCTIEGVEELQIVEKKLVAGAVGVPINFGPVAKADALLLFTPRPVGMHLNDADAPVVQSGSAAVLMDTNITSLFLDNNIETVPQDVVVEIWIVALNNG